MNKEKEIENGWENLEEKIERIMATVQQIKNKADDEVITQDQNIKEHKVELIPKALTIRIARDEI